MIAVPDPNPYAPSSALDKMDKDAHLRYVAARRWQVQRDQQRRRSRQQPDRVADRVKQIRELRPGRAVANSLSPVYNMFTDGFLRRR